MVKNLHFYSCISKEQAQAKLEELCHELSAFPVTLPNGQTLSFTVSIGYAMSGIEVRRFDDLYIQADEKLYEAKDAGRNCVR